VEHAVLIYKELFLCGLCTLGLLVLEILLECFYCGNHLLLIKILLDFSIHFLHSFFHCLLIFFFQNNHVGLVNLRDNFGLLELAGSWSLT
jgi:hypothetical protein